MTDSLTGIFRSSASLTMGVTGDAGRMLVQAAECGSTPSETRNRSSGALANVAAGIERDALGVAVELGFHANELRVHVFAAALGMREECSGYAGP